MNAEQWAQVKEVCIAALTLAQEKRASYVREACDEDWMVDEVRSLLSREVSAQQRLNQIPPEYIAAALSDGQLLIGSKIGNYVLRDLLGRGGMGEVYLAEDINLGRDVALKVLPKEFTEDEQALQRFKQEARAASGLKHRNILTIYSVGDEDGVHFIATEYVPGPTLRQKLNTPLELHSAVDIAQQIGSALEAAHIAGIVHRDVKPENIMFEPDGTVKLLDFGIAKLTEKLTPKTLDAVNDLPKTEQGMVLGTPAYMSPEQARHQQLDARSDLFSLGVVLYEMVTGTLPFAGETPYDQQAAVLVSEPTPLEQHLARVCPELQWVITKALQKEPARRYQTATDLLVDLRLLNQSMAAESSLVEQRVNVNLGDKASRAHANSRGRQRREQKGVTWLAAGVILIFLVGATVWWRTKLARLVGLHGPAPVIESIIPNRPIDIIGDQPIEVRGRDFQDGLKLKIGFPNGETGELSGAQIRKALGNTTAFEILIDLNGNPGAYSFQVVNPDGQESAQFGFEARHEIHRPVIKWIEPSNVKTSSGEQSIAVYGENFQMGVRVEVIQPNGGTSELRDRQIVNRTPKSFHALFFFHLPGKHSIRVVNPNGGKSEFFDIMVQ